MSSNLYMNLYVQQIFNQEPCKNDLVTQLTTFVFPMPCRKEKHGIFFSVITFQQTLDILLGSFFDRMAKNNSAGNLLSQKLCQKPYRVQNLPLDISAEHFLHQFDAWSRDKLSALQEFQCVCFFEVSFVYKCLCGIFMYSTW